MLSRRSLLGTLALAGCTSKPRNAFAGYAFVAARDSGDIALVNLAAFSLEKQRIRTAGQPLRLLDVPGEDSLFVVSANGALEEVEVSAARIRRRARANYLPASVQLGHDRSLLWGLSEDGKQVHVLGRDKLESRRRYNLPHAAHAMATSPETAHAAAALPAGVALFSGPDQAQPLIADLGEPVHQIRFLKNGSVLVAAQEEARQLTLIDTATGRVIVKLPLPIRPEHLCFNADGGQLFLSGDGVDGVVAVYPFQSQVSSTLLTGKDPGPMAASAQPQFLFVTSPSTGTVSVLDIRTQKLAAVVAVGTEPRCVVITPDNSMALVLNQRSGDMAIIRLANIVSKRHKTAPLFTMIPVGSAPVDAVVRSFAV